MLNSQPFNLGIVNGLVFLGHPIGDNIEKFSRKVDRAAVGQVAAMGQIHAEHGIPRLKYRKVNSHVGL